MYNIIITFAALIFTIMTASAQQTKVIAHRGAWKNTQLPQNSIASLRAAVEQKLWGTEFDIHKTKDGILVVNHDNDFFGMDIATSTYNELLAKKHSNGENIPTAEDFLKEGLKQKGTKLILELKTSPLGKEHTLEAARMAYALVEQLGGLAQTEFISFDYDACLEFRKANPQILVHYLMGDKQPQEILQDKLSGVDYHYTLFRKNENWIQEFKDLGLKTNSWTVNKKEDMQYLIEKSIDFITTDEPELLVETLGQ